MIKQRINKTIGLISLALFAIGILFISVSVDRVGAHNMTNNRHLGGDHMMNSDYSYINSPRENPEQKQEIIDLMKIHHNGEGENHNRQIYGSDSGAYCKIRCRSPTNS